MTSMAKEFFIHCFCLLLMLYNNAKEFSILAQLFIMQQFMSSDDKCEWVDIK